MPTRSPAYFWQHAHPPRRFPSPYFPHFCCFVFLLLFVPSPLPPFVALVKLFAQPPIPARLLSFSLLLPGRFCSLYRSQGSCLKPCPPCCCYLPLLPFPALCFYCFVLARAFPLYSPFSDTACNVFVSFRRFALPARLSLGFIKGRFPPCCACRRAPPFPAPLFCPVSVVLFRSVSFVPFPRFCKTFCTAVFLRSLVFLFLRSSFLSNFTLFTGHRTSALSQSLFILLLFLFFLFFISLSPVPFGTHFSSLLASYTAFQSAFLSALQLCFSCRFSSYFSKNKLPPCSTYRCACLFLSFLFFLSCSICFGTFILLCRVPIRLKESLCPCSFLRSSLAVFPALSALAFISLFSRASRQNTPSRLLFYAQKNRRIRRFFLYKLFLYALAFSINSPACSMPWPLSPSPPSSLATSFCRAVSSRRCTRVRVSSFSTVFSIR